MPHAKSRVTVFFKEIKRSKGPRKKYNFCCVDVAKLVFIAHNLELGNSENLPTKEMIMLRQLSLRVLLLPLLLHHCHSHTILHTTEISDLSVISKLNVADHADEPSDNELDSSHSIVVSTQ